MNAESPGPPLPESRPLPLSKKGSGRFLVGAAIVIGILLVVTVLLVATIGGRTAPLLPEDTPEGTVQRFLLAVEQRDWARAYSHIGPDAAGRKPEYEAWLRGTLFQADRGGWKATLGTTQVTGDQATVEIIVSVFRPGGPFEDPVRNNRVAYALKRDAGRWLITYPADLWWLY